MSKDVVFELEGASLDFGAGPVPADLHLRVRAGDRLALVGGSGSGKSTVLRMLLGFARPDRGHLAFEGSPYDASRVAAIRCRVGYLPQALDPRSEGLGDVMETLFRARRNRPTPTPQRLESVLRSLGLEADAASKPLGRLSGGERRRALLSLVLLLDRDILFLDEPTASLDRESAIRVVSALPTGTTVVVTTHDLDLFSGAGFRPVELATAGRSPRVDAE